MKKRWIVFFTLMALLLWGIRVVNLNREKGEDTHYIELGEEFYYGDIAIKAETFLMLEPEAYEAYFDVEEELEETEKVVCLKFRLRNDGTENASWEDVSAAMGEGFVCRGWCSSYDPFMTGKLNVFRTESLEAGTETEYWMVTSVSKICFREKTWETISEMEFEYVMQMYPGAVRIRLHAPELPENTTAKTGGGCDEAYAAV